MAYQLKLRNGTSTAWSTANPTLLQGEVGVDTTLNRFKIGNGTSAWNSLSFADVTGATQTLPYRSLGDGSDGNVSISSGTTTLSRDMYYNNLTISGTGSVFTNGYKIHVKGILDLTAAPTGAINFNGANGGNASGSTGGTIATVPTAGSIGTSGQGTAGANGTATTGTAATAVPGVTGNGGQSNTTGAGGTNGTNAGAAAQTGGTPVPLEIRRWDTNFMRGVTLLNGGVGGRGGSSGGGDGTNLGGGGGAGGNAGGFLALYVNVILLGSSTPDGAIQANGGNGGNGGTNSTGVTGGGGGGAGGGGGWVYIAYNAIAGSTSGNKTVQANGGVGGSGANSFGSAAAVGGGGGSGGYGGRITLYKIPAATGSEEQSPTSTLFNPEVTTGALSVGTSGGTGSAAGMCFVKLA